MSSKNERVTLKEAYNVGKLLGVDFSKTPLYWWRKGLEVELEHGTMYGSTTNVTNNDLVLTGRIALAHLYEHPRYYAALEKMEHELERDDKK